MQITISFFFFIAYVVKFLTPKIEFHRHWGLHLCKLEYMYQNEKKPNITAKFGSIRLNRFAGKEIINNDIQQTSSTVIILKVHLGLQPGGLKHFYYNDCLSHTDYLFGSRNVNQPRMGNLLLFQIHVFLFVPSLYPVNKQNTIFKEQKLLYHYRFLHENKFSSFSKQ